MVAMTAGLFTLAPLSALATKSLQSIVGGPMVHQMGRPSPAWVFVFVAAMASLYIGAILKMKRRPRWWQTSCFFASLAVTAAAVAGPLDRLAWERMFAAYIIEQILLYMLAAPLMLFGLPEWMIRPLLTRPWAARVTRFVSKPLVTFGAFTALFASIHYPPVCNAICHARPLFGPIRAALLAAGVLLWWPLLSPLPELTLSRPLQMLYLFLLLIPMTAVSAPITFSRSVVYSWLQGPPVCGLSPLSDQQIGGILMWVGQGFIVLSAGAAVFMRWAQEEGE